MKTRCLVRILSILRYRNFNKQKTGQAMRAVVISIRRRRAKCAVILLIALLVQGCAYMQVQRPLDTDYDRTSLGTKVGHSHSRSILWLFAWGDGGTKAAAENGNITTIRHADTQYKVVLFGLYTRVTTVVYGD